jgi:hypothetical protein
MGCKSCAETKRISALAKKVMRTSGEVAPDILEARFRICLTCNQHDKGRCLLLHGCELSDYSRKEGAICPHPEQKW